MFLSETIQNNLVMVRRMMKRKVRMMERVSSWGIVIVR